jgi:hypothetical protein
MRGIGGSNEILRMNMDYRTWQFSPSPPGKCYPYHETFHTYGANLLMIIMYVLKESQKGISLTMYVRTYVLRRNSGSW